jgi:hypothetical protein
MAGLSGTATQDVIIVGHRPRGTPCTAPHHCDPDASPIRGGLDPDHILGRQAINPRSPSRDRILGQWAEFITGDSRTPRFARQDISKINGLADALVTDNNDALVTDNNIADFVQPARRFGLTVLPPGELLKRIRQ